MRRCRGVAARPSRRDREAVGRPSLENERHSGTRKFLGSPVTIPLEGEGDAGLRDPRAQREGDSESGDRRWVGCYPTGPAATIWNQPI